MKLNKNLLIVGIVGLMAVLSACDKSKPYTIAQPPAQAHFTNVTVAGFFIRNTGAPVTYKIPVGLTKASTKDTKITVTVTSPTGAVAGTQYTLPSTTVTIPAGQVLDSLTVQSTYAPYASGRKDTLVFTISAVDGDATPSDYNKVYKLVLQRYCNVDLNAFVGAYLHMNDNDGSPIYTATVAAVTAANQLTATTGYITVTGLWGVPGSGPIRIDLDWTDPSNFKTSIGTGQNLYVDATYGQAKVRPNGVGTFSSCDNTLTLKYQVYVAAGNFAATTTTMAR